VARKGIGGLRFSLALRSVASACAKASAAERISARCRFPAEPLAFAQNRGALLLQPAQPVVALPHGALARGAFRSAAASTPAAVANSDSVPASAAAPLGAALAPRRSAPQPSDVPAKRRSSSSRRCETTPLRR
jgi:hypothetical protein